MLTEKTLASEISDPTRRTVDESVSVVEAADGNLDMMVHMEYRLGQNKEPENSIGYARSKPSSNGESAVKELDLPMRSNYSRSEAITSASNGHSKKSEVLFDKKSTVAFDGSSENHHFNSRSPARTFSTSASTAASPPYVCTPRSNDGEDQSDSVSQRIPIGGYPPNNNSTDQLLFSQKMAKDIMEMKTTLYIPHPLPNINSESPTPFTDLILTHGLRTALGIAIDKYLPELAKSMDQVLQRKHEDSGARNHWTPVDREDIQVTSSSGLFESLNTGGNTPSDFPPPGIYSRGRSAGTPEVANEVTSIVPKAKSHVEPPKSLPLRNSFFSPDLDLAHMVQHWGEDEESDTEQNLDQVGLSLLGNWTCSVRERVRNSGGVAPPPPIFPSPAAAQTTLSEDEANENDEFDNETNHESRLSPDAVSFTMPATRSGAPTFEVGNHPQESDKHNKQSSAVSTLSQEEGMDFSDLTRSSLQTMIHAGVRETAAHNHWAGNPITRPGPQSDRVGESVSTAGHYTYDQLIEENREYRFSLETTEQRFYDPNHAKMYGPTEPAFQASTFNTHSGYMNFLGDGNMSRGVRVDENSLLIGSSKIIQTEGDGLVRRYNNDQDRMVYVSWIPKKARAFTTSDKRKQELDLKKRLREELALHGLNKVLLFPPKGVHCKLIFDHRTSAATFLELYGGDNCSAATEKWKVDLCKIYEIDMLDRFDKTVVKIEWSQK